MKDKFEFIDHTADILFRCEAGSLERLFVQAGLAIGETTTRLNTIEEIEERLITGKNKNLEYLLFDFLDDLLFYKDAELLIFKKFEIKINKEGSEEYELTCKAIGEKLQEGKHERTIDIKAITMHMFEVKEVSSEKWSCQVLVDI